MALFVVLVGAIGAFAIVRTSGNGGSGPGEGSGDGSGGGPGGSGGGRSELVVLAVRGEGLPQPYLAVVGSGQRAPAAMIVPPSMTMILPGYGDGQARDAVDLPGPALAVATSNVLGMWTEHFAVTDAEHLRAYADRVGGVTVELPAEVTLSGTAVGPGSVSLSGGQLAAYLDAPGSEALRRWRAVLSGLLAGPFAPEEGELVQTDDLAAVTAILGRAKKAAVSSLPVERVTGGVPAPDYGKIAAAVSTLFGGRKAVPVPVLVLNGSGVPGVGEQVASLLVPGGFRVVDSENAATFDHKVTEVVAMGEEHRHQAQRARDLLGLGRVSVTDQSSGLADIAIVVGKDLSTTG